MSEESFQSSYSTSNPQALTKAEGPNIPPFLPCCLVLGRFRLVRVRAGGEGQLGRGKGGRAVGEGEGGGAPAANRR